jgi:hypothetical protein
MSLSATNIEYSGGGWVGTTTPTLPLNTLTLPMLASQNMGILPQLSADGLTAARCVIRGEQHGDVIDAFSFLEVSLRGFEMEEEEKTVHLTSSASFDIRRGLVSATQTVNTFGGGEGQPPMSNVCTVTHALRVLRHLPSLVLHTLTVNVPSGRQGQTFFMDHKVRGPASMGSSVSYNGSLYLVGDSSKFIMHSESDNGELEYASCYLVPNYVSMVSGGVRDVPGTSDASVRLKVDSAPGQIVFHVLSCVQRTRARETLLGVVRRTGGDVAADIVARHDAAWLEAWQSCVEIEPKEDLLPGEVINFNNDLFTLRHAMFAMHSTRGVLDVSGAAGAGADCINIQPLLVLLCPGYGPPGRRLSASDERRARELGLEGAYFDILCNDVGRATRATGGYEVPSEIKSWEASLPLRVFGSAMRAVNMWDYYRVTQDKLFLQEEGFPLISRVADMIVSASVSDDAQSSYPFYVRYHLPGVTGFDSTMPATTDQVLNLMCARAALRAAIEATFALGVKEHASLEAWTTVLNGLEVPLKPSQGQTILATDALGVDDPDPPSVRSVSDLMYPLCHPTVRALTLPIESAATAAIAATMEFWLPRTTVDSLSKLQTFLDAEFRVRKRTRANNALAFIHAMARRGAAGEVEAAANFRERLTAFLGEFRDGWGALRIVDKVQLNHADLDLSASLLLVMAQGLAGLTVNGSPAENNVYSTKLSITAATSAMLPVTWKRLIVRGAGRDKRDFAVWNRLLLPTGSLTANDVSPWSVDYIFTR